MLEKISDFFTARVDGYDEHMIEKVEGCKEAYIEMANIVPKNSTKLLDLGCGTGLELDEIFKLIPHVSVTGIDLTQAMLERLKQKYGDKDINIICGNYFDIDLGNSEYNCAISFQTMHHFSHKKKISLYEKVHKSLKENGVYIECDYMVENQSDEDFYFAENYRIRKEMNIPENEFYHYDTPCTIQNQLSMFEKAGFSKAEKVFRIENTTITIAYK